MEIPNNPLLLMDTVAGLCEYMVLEYVKRCKAHPNYKQGQGRMGHRYVEKDDGQKTVQQLAAFVDRGLAFTFSYNKMPHGEDVLKLIVHDYHETFAERRGIVMLQVNDLESARLWVDIQVDAFVDATFQYFVDPDGVLTVKAFNGFFPFISH